MLHRHIGLDIKEHVHLFVQTPAINPIGSIYFIRKVKCEYDHFHSNNDSSHICYNVFFTFPEWNNNRKSHTYYKMKKSLVKIIKNIIIEYIHVTDNNLIGCDDQIFHRSTTAIQSFNFLWLICIVLYVTFKSLTHISIIPCFIVCTEMRQWSQWCCVWSTVDIVIIQLWSAACNKHLTNFTPGLQRFSC